MFALFREPEWTPRFNISPGEMTLTIRIHPDGKRLASPAQWGLVPEHAKHDLKYWQMSRAETVATMWPFSTVFGRQHCLIVADGFYEWQKFNRRESQPWHIYRDDKQPLVMAGIWDHWQTSAGELLESFAMITTASNEFMSEIHHRMPLILGPDDWAAWLTTTNANQSHLMEMLTPCPSDWLQRTAVSNFVNKTENDSPECIQPVKPLKMLF